MTWSAGERADAHQVSSVLREKFSRPSKHVSRDFVATALAQSEPKVVLELWGGGGGTRSLGAALPAARIISVENGSVCGAEWFVDRLGRRITKARLKRAHLIDCEEQGVEPFWGDLGKAVADFTPDAVHADLCEQWSPSLARLLASFAEIKTLAITIMPERDGLGRLGLNNRLVSLTALVSAHTGLSPWHVTSYDRNDLGQDMALLVMRGRDEHSPRVRSGWGLMSPQNILRALDARGRWASGLATGGSAMRRCADCDTVVATPRARRCPSCAAARTRVLNNGYRKRPEALERAREYDRKRRATARFKESRSRPEALTRQREYQAAWRERRRAA